MDKKNLDELFREKFKAFREVPDEKVWTAIERSLDNRRKRRVVPLWWKLGGAAAVLAIALIALYPFYETENEIPIITNTDDMDNTEKSTTPPENVFPDNKGSEENTFSVPATGDNAVVEDSHAADNKSTESEAKLGRPKTSFSDNDRSNNDPGGEAAFPPTNVKQDQISPPRENTQVTANEDDKNRESGESINKTEEYKSYIRTKEANRVLDNRIMNRVTARTPTMDTVPVPAENNLKIDDGLATVREGPKTTTEEAQEKSPKNDVATGDDDKTDDNKKSIFEALEEQADEDKIAEDSHSRWSAGPSVAPVYFNAMGEGSPIDPSFSPNSKSGSTNLSYGLSVAYAISNKVSVRSGIHKAEYGYNTNHVGFSPTLAASSGGRLQNIDYGGSSGNFAANSPNLNLDASENVTSEFSALNSVRDGTVAQNFGYLEVPLEIDYTLIDRRFGVNLVGGISSLFLIDNSVTLSSGELSTAIGEANNLNDLNFSTNIGFGVNYKFTPKLRLNIEPLFKYQLNTFSNTSGDFRPYSIGVYSGLNFKF